MRLKRLLLERYGLFKGEVELLFSDSGIDIIVGDNESGKSTIMDGILSTIFGTKREERENLIPWNESSSGEGTLEFNADKNIRIRRTIENQHTALTLNHNSEPLELFSDKASPQGKKEAAHYFNKLNDIFGFSDRNILESLTFVKQNETETELGESVRELISGSGRGDYKKAIEGLRAETLLITRNVYWSNPTKDRMLEKLEDELSELKYSLEEAVNIRDEGGDVEGELKEAEIRLGKLKKELKSEETKLKSINKFIKSIEELNRLKSEHQKILDLIRETKKQLKEQEELEEKLKDESVIQIKEAGESLREELNELKGIEKKKKELEKEIEELKRTKPEKAEVLSGGLKAAIVIAAAAVGFIFGQLLKSTHVSSLLSVLFGGIAIFVLWLIERKKPVLTDTRLSVRKSDLSKQIEKEDELLGKYSIMLSDRSIDETLKLIDSVNKWETELKLTRKNRTGKCPKEELEDESNSLLQDLLKTEMVIKNLEKELPELLKTERKMGESDALKAEQIQLIEKMSTESDSLDALIRENEKKIAKHEGQGVGNIDLINHEISALEEEIEAKRLVSGALQLALKTLEDSVEKFQESHHGRLSERISGWFERFTGGRYSGVTLNDDWSPIITTKDGKPIEPRRLSVGAKDQLYFAMRLSLAELMADDEKLPIVLDDPFVNYDNKRLEISKELLNEISEEHQVILFTHSPDYAKWGTVILDLNDYWEKLK